MNNIRILSHTVGNNSYNIENLDFDKISIKTNVFKSDEIKDFSRISLSYYDSGEAFICGSALDFMYKNGLASSQIPYETKLQSYSITIDFYDGKSTKLFFFDKTLADKAYIYLETVIHPTHQALEKLCKIFDDKGDFLFKGFDLIKKEESNLKYRENFDCVLKENDKFFESVNQTDLVRFIQHQKCSPFSDIVKFYYVYVTEKFENNVRL